MTSTIAPRPRRRTAVFAALVLATVTMLAACGDDSGDGSGQAAAGGDEQYRVAFLAASSQNGYNKAVFDGIQNQAGKLGNVKATILDGQFDGQVQFNQLQDAAASGQYDGMVIVPNDTISIAGAITAAKDANIPVVTALFPIGPDLTKLEPQVPGWSRPWPARRPTGPAGRPSWSPTTARPRTPAASRS